MGQVLIRPSSKLLLLSAADTHAVRRSTPPPFCRPMSLCFAVNVPRMPCLFSSFQCLLIDKSCDMILCLNLIYYHERFKNKTKQTKPKQTLLGKRGKETVLTFLPSYSIQYKVTISTESDNLLF